MNKFKWRKWLRILHRDLGYLFFALTVIYSLSGIAINHLKDWDPNYAIYTNRVNLNLPQGFVNADKSTVVKVMEQIGEEGAYKKHYIRGNGDMKVFLGGGGSLLIDPESGEGFVEKIQRRPILHAVNFLHYNPGNWWTMFSDIFAGALIFLAVSGLFLIKGKKGITGRGAWLTILGIIIPVLYLILFYS